MKFELVSKFKPTGDQPKAIDQIVKKINSGTKHQILLGVTGSGKTFTMAKVIEKTQKPTLIISPNKTLAAQLYQEFKSFFPKNAVHYFVSYYDYYQPEAYIPQTDTYIDKDSKINEELDHLRHAAVQDLLSRKDVIIVASVSCIYNIGSPEDYQKVSLEIKKGQNISRKELISHLVSLQYKRNDFEFLPGSFRVRGNMVEISLVTGQEILRIDFAENNIENILTSKNGLVLKFITINAEKYRIFPANFWVSPQEKLKIALGNIKIELEEQILNFKKENKLLEAERIEQRTNYDLEMLKETGYCHGVENYSGHLEFRKTGQAPFSLVNYFSKDFLMFIDESHQTLPQIHAMAIQDRKRKEPLINFGFRLPSAFDNRPLNYNEFEKRINQVVYVSATPAKEEIIKTGRENIVEQLIRPTGLLEPAIEIKNTKNQIQDLIKEIRTRIVKKQRTLVVTLTKRLAEAISDRLSEEGIKNRWLHSEIKTLERPKILNDFRKGKYDVLVGINLLREGLDLPEVTLVAILDADKEGFLRSETTLIQTMGRAARHIDGKVILYADKKTQSMESAIKEIERRRKIQENYNKKYKITPKTIIKTIENWPFLSKEKEIKAEFWQIRDTELLEKEMREAAKELNFERAAQIRDLIKDIKKPKQPLQKAE